MIWLCKFPARIHAMDQPQAEKLHLWEETVCCDHQVFVFCCCEKMPRITPGFLMRLQPKTCLAALMTSAWWVSWATKWAMGRKWLVLNAPFIWDIIRLQIGLQVYAITRWRLAVATRQQYIPLFYHPACELMNTSMFFEKKKWGVEGGGRGGDWHFPLKKQSQRGRKTKTKIPKMTSGSTLGK